MAEWSKIVDGSALDCLKTLQKFQTNEICFDLEPGSKESVDGAEEDKLRFLFEQLLCIFLKEIRGSDCFRPLPPMIGDGQSVDLFKLYLVVREKGGYETVSRNGLWDLVAEESGLGPGVGSTVKLIYVKYLDTLDRWLQSIVKVEDSKGSGTDLSGSLMELEPQFRAASSEISDHQKNDGEYSHLDLEKSELNFTDVGKLCRGHEVRISVESNEGKRNVDVTKKVYKGKDRISVESDEGRRSVDGTKKVYKGKDNLISDASVLTEEASNRKRKRECHQRMLDWVVEIAKNPCSIEVGSLPERSMWKYYGIDQLWKQVLLAREAMFLKRKVDIRADQSISDWLTEQKMHPSTYDDYTESERLIRCSQRLLSAKEYRALPSKKSHSRASSESSSGTQSDLEDHFDKESDPSSADSVVGLFGYNYSCKRVPVGPFFQANIPEWTGEAYGSDSRWLGSRVWPLESGEHNKYLIERDRIGKGRQDSCGCQHPGSVECARFHVAEKRMRVKLELGLAFHRWKFDKMGEEVALTWTKEEEKRFQAIIRLNPPSLDKCFWDEMFKSFPSKSREVLVSYYFNVFLIQRRGYQNRSTPRNIDSDDEESEFGLLTNGLGHEAVKSPGSIFRSPKKPHLNFR